MKKALSSLLSMVFLFALLTGCSSDSQDSPNDTSLQSSPTSSSVSIDPADPDPTFPNDDPVPPLSEPKLPDLDEPLFLGDTYNNSFHYVNQNGDILNEADSPLPFYAENGLGATSSPVNGLVGFVDRDGVFVIDPQFDDAGPFGKNGLAAVAFTSEDGFSKKWGFINEQGQIVIPCEYDSVTPFNKEGYAVVGKKTNNGYSFGVINSRGSFCIPPDPSYRAIELADEYVIIDSSSYTTEITPTGDSATIYSLEIRNYANKKIDSVSQRNITRIVPDSIAKQYQERYEYQVWYSDESQCYLHYFTESDGYYRCERGQIYKYAFSDYSYDEYNVPVSYKTTIYRLSGGRFVETSFLLDYDCQTETKMVSSTMSGYGTKIVCNGKELSAYEYDQVETFLGLSSRYLLAFKYQNHDGSEYTYDIFDLQAGIKTAEGISYDLCSEYDLRLLPDGYYMFRYYRFIDGKEIECYGIIDYTGTIIMEPMYEKIIPWTYDYLAATMSAY